LVLQFFRSPKRDIIIPNDNIIYAPADGKIVAIEEVKENEYFEVYFYVTNKCTCQ